MILLLSDAAYYGKLVGTGIAFYHFFAWVVFTCSRDTYLSVVNKDLSYDEKGFIPWDHIAWGFRGTFFYIWIPWRVCWWVLEIPLRYAKRKGEKKRAEIDLQRDYDETKEEIDLDKTKK